MLGGQTLAGPWHLHVLGLGDAAAQDVGQPQPRVSGGRSGK